MINTTTNVEINANEIIDGIKNTNNTKKSTNNNSFFTSEELKKIHMLNADSSVKSTDERFVSVRKVSIKELLSIKNFSIPIEQRPPEWNADKIRRFLSDSVLDCGDVILNVSDKNEHLGLSLNVIDGASKILSLGTIDNYVNYRENNLKDKHIFNIASQNVRDEYEILTKYLYGDNNSILNNENCKHPCLETWQKDINWLAQLFSNFDFEHKYVFVKIYAGLTEVQESDLFNSHNNNSVPLNEVDKLKSMIIKQMGSNIAIKTEQLIEDIMSLSRRSKGSKNQTTHEAAACNLIRAITGDTNNAKPKNIVEQLKFLINGGYLTMNPNEKGYKTYYGSALFSNFDFLNDCQKFVTDVLRTFKVQKTTGHSVSNRVSGRKNFKVGWISPLLALYIRTGKNFQNSVFNNKFNLWLNTKSITGSEPISKLNRWILGENSYRNGCHKMYVLDMNMNPMDFDPYGIVCGMTPEEQITRAIECFTSKFDVTTNTLVSDNKTIKNG